MFDRGAQRARGFSAAAAIFAALLNTPSATPLQTPTPQTATPPLAHPAEFTATAPATYRAVLDTTVGFIVIRVQRDWAPHGADRFYNLVKAGFYDQCRFFRVVPKFVAQFGIHGTPEIAAAWQEARLPPDRAWQSNSRGRVTFAMAGATTRTTQVFINLAHNNRLDIDGFAPFGEVVSSMIIVDRLYSEYGEGVDQNVIVQHGNAFLAKYLPRLDFIKTARLEP
jgi:peptidyl-prolyl cis-trans isomerase A (cyclophilin A)